jgi:TM2 domain-containing membrane protein YozV
MAMVFCTGCGKQIHDSAPTCPNCGAVQLRGAVQVAGPVAVSVTDKRILPAFLLCFFLGLLGVHRFYVGKVGSGVAQLLTVGGLFIWAFVDLIVILCGGFTDGNGNKITQWT